MLKNLIIFAVLGGAFALLVKDSQTGYYTNRYGEIVPNLAFLGTVGTKSYFVDRTFGNWSFGKGFCESMNLRLASIESTQERDFLASAYKPYVFDGGHWTAARDSHNADQFLWHNTENKITVPLEWRDSMGNETFLTCGVYFIWSLSNSAMRIHKCSEPDGFTLCETW